MLVQKDDGARGRNRLLARLSPAEFEAFRRESECVELRSSDVIYLPHTPIASVYFPLSGVISLLAFPEAETGLEVAVVGNEGMVGLPIVLGADSAPHQAICQIPGQAYRLPAEAFRAAIDSLEAFRRLLLSYTQSLFTHVAQTAVCNRHHLIGQRCARWLLEAHDRIEGDRFTITHEFLSQMLGVRRATVTEIVGELQRRGVLHYQRGVMTVLDRAGLDTAACGCYRTIRTEYDRLLPA